MYLIMMIGFFYLYNLGDNDILLHAIAFVGYIEEYFVWACKKVSRSLMSCFSSFVSYPSFIFHKLGRRVGMDLTWKILHASFYLLIWNKWMSNHLLWSNKEVMILLFRFDFPLDLAITFFIPVFNHRVWNNCHKNLKTMLEMPQTSLKS